MLVEFGFDEARGFLKGAFDRGLGGIRCLWAWFFFFELFFEGLGSVGVRESVLPLAAVSAR